METTKMIVKELEAGLKIFVCLFLKPQKPFGSSLCWILSFKRTVNFVHSEMFSWGMLVIRKYSLT